MIASATSNSSFSKKAKSPYVLQYLNFEQRMKDPSKQKKICPLRSRSIKLQCRTLQNQPNDTLDIVKEIIKNKNKLWVEDKENMLTIEDNQHMLTIKSRLQRIKSLSIHSRKDMLQQSRDLNKIDTQEEAKSNAQINSRVASEKFLNHPPQPKVDALNFLNYKKSKRSILAKFKRI